MTFSSEYNLDEDCKTQKLVSICKQANANIYYSGPAAKNYMDIDLFEKENIEVRYFDYSNYKEYNQLHDKFEHGVTILDLLLNEGNFRETI